MASVTLDGVGKTYPNGTEAVADVSLAIADGELLVLVGPSGCGKSTLLRMIAGLETVTSGTLKIGDGVVNTLSPQARNVAMVFQDYALYPHMTVRRNLELPLRMRKMPADEMERRVRSVADLLGLGELLDRLPKQLSGGQRQRVAMGRALVREPAVFLLDEPLSNLDAKLRVQVRAEIAELQQRTKTTMIYVTHDQVEAMTLGDRVAVMDRGRLQQVAPPAELYEHPASAFVAGFIGNPPMNLLPARLRLDGERIVVTIADQRLTLPAEGVAAKVARDGAGDQEITTGIRPEALHLVSDDEAGAALHATVEHVEWLGHETLAYVAIGTGKDAVRLVARLPGMRSLTKDDRVNLTFDPASLHLFAPDGRAISSEGTAPPLVTPRQ